MARSRRMWALKVGQCPEHRRPAACLVTSPTVGSARIRTGGTDAQTSWPRASGSVRCGDPSRPERAQALGTPVQCGDTITEDTKLDSDLVDCAGDGIVIGADGVTLDLNGHTIDGNSLDQYVGVQNFSGYDNNTIENGTLRDFGSAVFLNATDDSVLRRLSVESVGEGLTLLNSHNNQIKRNLITGTLYCAVCVLDSSPGRNLIDHNTVSGAGSWAIYVIDSVATRVVRNEVSESLIGIRIAAARDTRVENNSVSSNSEDGIRVDDDSSATSLRGNTANGNAHDGIHLQELETDVQATTLKRNVANFNGDLGIEAVPGVIDGGGNRAFGNGNPLQCLNVHCN
jgi:parallel beta-helix repeat protein